MKQQLYDKELRLDCVCGEPWHFVHLGFLYPGGLYDEGLQKIPEMAFSMQLYHGSLWARIREAVRHVFRGWLTAESNSYFEGADEIAKLRDFLDGCLKCVETKKVKDKYKKIELIRSPSGKEFFINEEGVYTCKQDIDALLKVAKNLLNP